MSALVLAMTLWGTLGAFALWSGLSSIEVAFYRCLIGAACTGFVLYRRGERIAWNRETGRLAAAGALLVLNWVFLFESFRLASITVGNMSYYLQPFLLVLLGRLFYGERIGGRRATCLLLAGAGVLLTLDVTALGQGNTALGATWALLAALFYSFVTLLMKKVAVSLEQAIFVQLTVGTLLLGPWAGGAGSFGPMNAVAGANVLVIGLVHTVLAYRCYYRGIRKTNFAVIAVVSYLDPIVAIATDVVFFGRHLSALQLAGITLTFAAAGGLVRAGRRRAVSPALAG